MVGRVQGLFQSYANRVTELRDTWFMQSKHECYTEEKQHCIEGLGYLVYIDDSIWYLQYVM